MRKTFLILMTPAALFCRAARGKLIKTATAKPPSVKISRRHARLLPRRQLLENMNYNQYRPERRAVLPDQTGNNADEEHRQHWQKPKFQNR
ncbi:putative hydrolase [Neisseria gonorrhoeae]|uniref:Putative hydrolase n=1 Tax=Neisseria gonorrhoeae TaxID=485 RepID=A0A378W3R9_NEIGO|nr:putative hydrolase [Neisseria gonorrhoeae]